MKNSFGNSLTVTVFGESHGEYIGAVIDGIAPGIRVDDGFIRSQLTKRRPAGALSTARREQDEYKIISGAFDGFTTGAPLCIIIPNGDSHSGDYTLFSHVARPGHADYTAYCKYHGYHDHRGGGHFSGRVTAALVAAGAVIISALNAKGIHIGTHILRLGDISDRAFSDADADIKSIASSAFPVLDNTVGIAMKNAVLKAKDELDSIGGVLETAICGIPAGVGEPMFDTLEGVLAHGLFAIPGIKGVQFGSGFDGCVGRGSDFNDEFAVSNGNIVTVTNSSGGINGGITNGMPVIFRCAVRPTPSIAKKQKTVDFKSITERELEITGRHDPAIIHRAAVVVDSIAAFAVADMLTQRFGTEFFAGGNK